MTDNSNTIQPDPAPAPAPAPDPAPQAPAPAPAPAAKSADWTETLSESHRDFISKNGYKDISHALDSAIHAQKLLGVKDRTGLVMKPQGDRASNPDSWKELDALYGVPDAADKYPDVTAPEGFELQDGVMSKLKETALARGIPAESFGGFVEAGLAILAEQGGSLHATANAELEAMGADLAKDWGAQYDANIEMAKGVIANFADKDFVAYLDQTGLTSDPRMIRMMHKMAGAVSEGGGLPGDLSQRGGAPSLADIERDISDFNVKHEKAIFDRKHSNHDWANKERQRLYELREKAKG